MLVMALKHSASAPQLAATRDTGSSATLKASAGAMGLASSSSSAMLTTTLYDKMASEGKFRNYVAPKVLPAGRSITVPLNDSAERDLQSEVYFPAPPTPAKERRFRKMSAGPGEIGVHWGLKHQKLPGKEFRFGVRSAKSVTTEESMKAGMKHGVAEYKNNVSEMIYESNKKEPLGRPYDRGHELKMLPQGYGLPSGEPEDGKCVLWHKHLDPHADTDEVRAQYRKTHKSYGPGERHERNYAWPAETQQKGFKFGAGLAAAVEGAGAKLALNLDIEEDGTYKKTRFVTKIGEDFRSVTRVAAGRKKSEGKGGPTLNPEHRYGVKSSISDYSAGSCVKGYYSLEEQLPDEDLGRCCKPGRRNITSETRAFGTPSIRTDIAAPHPSKRSLADECSYGDEPSAASILAPQRFDAMGIADGEFLLRREEKDLRELLERFPLEDVDFDSLWRESLALFDDDIPLVSLDAILYVHSAKIESHVATRLNGLHLTNLPIKPVA